MKACLDGTKANEIDAKAIERMIAKLRLAKEQDGRGLTMRTVNKILTTTSRVFRFGMANKKTTGVQLDPVKLIEKTKDASGEQTETGEPLYNGIHEVTDREVLTPQEVNMCYSQRGRGYTGQLSRRRFIPAPELVNCLRSGGRT